MITSPLERQSDRGLRRVRAHCARTSNTGFESGHPFSMYSLAGRQTEKRPLPGRSCPRESWPSFMLHTAFLVVVEVTYEGHKVEAGPAPPGRCGVAEDFLLFFIRL